MSTLTTSSRPAPHFSIPAILAVIAAFISFGTHSAALGFFMAIIAILLGVVGFLIAFLPGVRGGIVSFISIGAGLLGIIVAIARLIGHAGNGTGY